MSVKNIVYLTDVSQITCVVQEGRGDVILNWTLDEEWKNNQAAY